MSRHMAVAVVLSALFTGTLAHAAETSAYCPPGAKYCPSPNDAPPGQTFGLAALDNPNPANYQLNDGERLIMVVPSVDPTNRYVPPEQAFGGAPAPAAPGNNPYPYQALMQPQQQRQMTSPAPQYAARPAPAPRRDDARFTPANQVMVDDAHSEVANETFRRDKKAISKNDEKIPWWKGGMWRNKKDDGSDGAKTKSSASTKKKKSSSVDDDDPVAARRSGGSRQAPRVAEDDLWDDRGGDEYDGYNSDGSFGRQANTPRPPSPRQFDQEPYGNQYDPYGGQSAYNGGGGYDPYGQQGYGAPQPYTDPNAPLGAYVDPNAQFGSSFSDPYAAQGPYDTSMYGSVPAVDATTGSSIGSYTNGYTTDPYASTGSFGGGYDQGGFVSGGQTQSDPFAALPTQPQPFNSSPGFDVQGGPQFENAVRMVKENRFTEAKAILASETQRNPSNAAAWRWLADCHYNLLELDDAINCYRQSLERDHGDYYALRGQGFSYLHRGHEYWRRMQEEVAQNKKEAAASTFALAHDDYKKALEMLGLCLRRAPNDGEAIYGEAMAAEGASRKLYSNAISYLKLGPDQRERAELFAENCMTVINKGIERSKERSKQAPGDSGPRALLGGLYLRKATLYYQLGKNDLALVELRNARDAQRSILDEIDKNNATAQKAIQEIETLWNQWGGNR